MLIQNPTQAELAAVIEHTLLRADATAQEIERLCQEARWNCFHAVCVNGSRVAMAHHLLEDTEVKVVAVAGFPLGASDPDVKRYETEAAVDSGASEIDVVMNIGKLRDGDTKAVLRELRDVVEAADERPVKVIIETSALTREQKLLACGIVVDSGAQFVKTSTGFGSGGATIEDILLLREAVGSEFGIKASGGIRTCESVLALIRAGANRIGTSHGVAILEQYDSG